MSILRSNHPGSSTPVTSRSKVGARGRSWVRAALALLPLVLLASCRDEASETGTGGSGPGVSGSGVCYVETKVGFWCDDGQVDPGVWQVACFDVPEERCNAEAFPSTTEYESGCDWEKKFERHAFMTPEACEQKEREGLLLHDGEDCAYHEHCQSGCCGSPTAGYVCVPCE
jgi:hypothetical protein